MQEEKWIKKEGEKLVVCLPKPDVKSETVWMQMLEDNEIPGTLKLWTHIVDGEKKYFYETTGLRSLEEYLKEETAEEELLREILCQLIKTLLCAPEYFFIKESYMLSPDKIFWHVQKQKLYLCYHGEMQRDYGKQMEELAEFLMAHVNHKSENARKLAYRFYDMVLEQMPLEEIEKICLERRQERHIKKDKKISDRGKAASKKKVFKDGKIEAKREKQWYLAWQQDARGKLLQQICGSKSNVLIRLDVLPCIIGRDAMADYCIKNSGISRSHLRIEREGNLLYATDLQSSNGTLVNGKRLKAGIRTRLREGDRLVLAGEIYRVESR